MSTDKVQRRVIDGHSHIGEMQAWKFYDLAEPVKPTVYEFASTGDYLGYLDKLGVERGLVISNYGIPVQRQPLGLNTLVLVLVVASDRLAGAVGVALFEL